MFIYSLIRYENLIIEFSMYQIDYQGDYIYLDCLYIYILRNIGNEIKTTLFSVIFMYYKFCKMLITYSCRQQNQQNKHKYKIHLFVRVFWTISVFEYENTHNI